MHMVRWRMLKVKSPPPRFPLSPIPWAPSAEQPTHSITYLVNHFYRLIGNTIGCKAGAFDYKQLKVRCCKTCQAIGRTARIKCWVKKKKFSILRQSRAADVDADADADVMRKQKFRLAKGGKNYFADGRHYWKAERVNGIKIERNTK